MCLLQQVKVLGVHLRHHDDETALLSASRRKISSVSYALQHAGPGTEDYLKNNYPRPGGNQNLGNRISDRPSSRVLAPPGGKSQVSDA